MTNQIPEDMQAPSLLNTPTSRRSLLRWGGIAAAAGTLAACGAEAAPTAVATTAGDHDDHTPASGQSDATDWQEMDRMHEERMKIFPAETKGYGLQRLEPKIENGVKVFDLTCSKIQWETEPGKVVEAWAYNEQVPGPEIRVTEGDKVRINVTNNLDQSTSIHWHGLYVPNAMDGVTYITQKPITPGSTFTYEFPIRNFGSHMYHSHHNSTKQVGMGLLGPFIVEPKDKKQDPEFDLEYTLILNDTGQGMTINGKSFPATKPLTAKKGQKVRIRYMNEGLLIHPMHLHGMPQRVFAKDGWNLPQPYLCDTLNVAPGERWDTIVDCTDVGVWAFHCHILSHAESEHGMFGMVTVLIVEE